MTRECDSTFCGVEDWECRLRTACDMRPKATLRSLAILAHRAEVERQEERERREAEQRRESARARLEEALVRVFGAEVAAGASYWFDGEHYPVCRATVEGMDFHLGPSTQTYLPGPLFLSAICPDCDCRVSSYPLADLADLGRALTEHRLPGPHNAADCGENRLMRESHEGED